MIGFNLYALLGVGAVVVALGGYGAYQYQRAEASNARAERAESRVAALTETLKGSEEENARLLAAGRALDAALVQRDKRARALEETKRKLQGELDELKAKLPQEDRECLDRALPPAIAERLRNP